MNIRSAFRERSNRRGQSGVSLIEVLVGVLVMMPLTLTAAMGLMVTVSASDTAETQQELQIALTTATENIKAMPYLECGSAKQYLELYRTWVPPLAARVVDGVQTTEPEILEVAYWNRAKAAYTDGCGNDDGAQRLTVTVRSGDSSATGTIVKRDEGASVKGS